MPPERSSIMAKPEPSMDQWLAEAKASENADKCGMFLTHNGVVRVTAKAQVRQGEEKPPVAQVDFSYDADHYNVLFKDNIIEFVYQNKDRITDYEIIKGSMDDVFLNLTGREMAK